MKKNNILNIIAIISVLVAIGFIIYGVNFHVSKNNFSKFVDKAYEYYAKKFQNENFYLNNYCVSYNVSNYNKNYKGYVVGVINDNKIGYYMTIYNDKFMIIKYKYGDDLKIKKYKRSDKLKLDYLMEGFTCDNIKDNTVSYKSLYSYHLSSADKETIEKDLNRKIDYSIDHFYFIDDTHIYNTSNNKIYDITTNGDKNLAIWLWGDPSNIYDDQNEMDKMFSMFDYYNVNLIYYCVTINDSNIPNIKKLISEAYLRDMKVYLLTGDNSWGTEDKYQSTIYDLFKKVNNYNKSVNYNERFAGITYDNEVYSNENVDWDNSNSDRVDFINYIKEAKTVADSYNLEVSFDLPFWINHFNVDYNGETSNMFDLICDSLDTVVMMTYRDTSDVMYQIITDTTDSYNSLAYYAKNNNTNIYFGIETGDASKGEGGFISVYEEELAKRGYINDLFNDLTNRVDSDLNYNFAIHHVGSLYDIYYR